MNHDEDKRKTRIRKKGGSQPGNIDLKRQINYDVRPCFRENYKRKPVTVTVYSS